MNRLLGLLLAFASTAALGSSTIEVNPFSGGGSSGAAVSSVVGVGAITVNPTTGNTIVTLNTPLLQEYGGTGVTGAAVFPTSGYVATYPVPTASLSGTFVSSVVGGGSITVTPTTGAVVVSLANPLTVAEGGTNSSTALSNSRVMVSTGGAVVEAAAITPLSALQSDANGIPVASLTTSTELGYVHGVTSAIQTQINAINSFPGLTGDVTATPAGVSTVQFVGGQSAASTAAVVTEVEAATPSDTAGTIVVRNGSGNFSAGTITGSLAGNASTATLAGNVTGVVAVANGGTNSSTALVNGRVMVSSAGAVVENSTAPGNISTSTTGVTVGSGAAATIGPSVTIDVQTATASQPGLLSAANWTTFNGKLAAPLTGDVTATSAGVTVVAAVQGTTVSGTTGTGNVVFSANPTFSGTVILPTFTGQAAGGAVSITGGTAASNSNGGQVTIGGANGSGTGSGGNGGNLNLNGGNANGNNTANQSGGAISIQAGTSYGSQTGGTVTVSSGTGGVGTGSAGATGGTTNVNGGTGGAGSATSGNGGGATLKAGSGGGGVAGGQGGQAQVVGGTGGTGSSSGGTGGSVQISGGSPGNVAGSQGGNISINAGNGTTTGSGGAGGTVTIATGQGNGDNTVNHSGGSLTLSVGKSYGSSGGSNAQMTAGTGGPGTGTAGANGGNTILTAGSGGIGSSTGGNGGSLQLNGGLGGASTTPGAAGIIQFFTGVASELEQMRITPTAVLVSNVPVEIGTAGNGLQVKAGSNCKLGTAVLSGGTVTVSNTTVTSNSLIFLTSQADGGTPGFVRVTAKSNGTSFTITSSNAADTSTVAWMIVEEM